MRLMLVMLVACRHAGDYGATQAPIEPPPPSDAPAVAATPALIETVDGAAPASAPVGDPIEITYVPPKVGDTRERTLRMTELYDTTIDGSSERKTRHQQSEHSYRMREEVTALDHAHVAAMRVTVHEAHEKIVMDGDPHEMELLAGTYQVTMEHGTVVHHRLKATQETGGDVGSRELEELELLFALDAGDEPGLVHIIRDNPLRLHQSVTLSEAEKEVYAAGPATKDPIALTLVDASGGFATYEIDMVRTDTAGGLTSVLRLRERSKLRIATGQLVEQLSITNKSEQSTGMSQEMRAKAELTFSIVPH